MSPLAPPSPRLFAELEAAWQETVAKGVDCVRGLCVRLVVRGSIFCSVCGPYMRGQAELDPLEKDPKRRAVTPTPAPTAEEQYVAAMAGMYGPV